MENKDFFKPYNTECISESVGPVVRFQNNKENVIKLHQVTTFFTSENKTKIGEYRSQKYKAPTGMCKFEICKILSNATKFCNLKII